MAVADFDSNSNGGPGAEYASLMATLQAEAKTMNEVNDEMTLIPNER
jgi:hypothetical protein